MRDMLAGHFHKLLVIYYFDLLINQSSSWESNCAVATLCASLKEAHNRLTIARLVKRRRHLVLIYRNADNAEDAQQVLTRV